MSFSQQEILMAANDVAALGSIITFTASKIQEFGNNWYRASEAWTDFPRQVKRLGRKAEVWQDNFRRFGMSDDKGLIETLTEAKFLLEEELVELSKRQVKAANFATGWWVKLKVTVFPAKLGLSLDTAIRAFDDIPEFLKMEDEATRALEQRALRRPVSMLVRKDYRYVPLEASESAVRSALDKANLVLLHGGPGKGKSTLAGAVALHYTEAVGKAAVFEHVVYLECGSKAEISDKQFKLLQLLGSDPATPGPQEQARQPGSPSDLTIPRRLKNLLRDRNLLIILDDVWEPQFLKSMVDLCGKRVKCLVTSQLGDLCRGLNYSSIDIQIEDVQPEDARKILASHVGLSDHHIPRHLERIAEKMIHETEGNPLALASIATAIDPARSDELSVWEAASNDLFQMLHLESSVHILSLKYPRSFWSTMKLSFDSLEKEAQKLLILVHLTDGLSVPEEVIDVLYRSAKGRGGSAVFARLRKDLESRELVKITLVSNSPEKQRSWSTHSLQKRFIEEEMKDARESTFTSLRGLSNIVTESTVEPEIIRKVSIAEETIVIALAALYFDKQFAARAASKIGVPSHRFNNLRRSAIEPVTRLLGQPFSDRWTETLRTSAKQVFTDYICNGEMKDENISDLLVSPLSTLGMMSALKDVALLGETILDENRHGFMKPLVGLVEGGDGGGNSNIRVAAGETLSRLCGNASHRAFIVNKLPSVLDTVVKVLLTDSHPRMVSWSALMLVHLSLSEVNARQIVGRYPEALAGLVKSLSKKDNPQLQAGAAFALASLARGDNDTKSTVAKCHDAVERLVKSLCKKENPILQGQAARALANLASGDDNMKLKNLIANSLGAVEELVKSLSRDENPDLQKQAARTLAKLAGGENELKLKITNSLGAVEKLVGALWRDENPNLQEVGARALANLAYGDDKMKLKITNCLGVLEGLGKSLSRDDNPDLQKQAARALINLVGGDHEVKLKIANSLGVVEELRKSLSKDNNLDLQKQAARCLAILATGDDTTKLQIGNCLGVIEDLGKSLSKDDNHDLQKQVARALANIGSGDQRMKSKISNSCGVIEQLGKSLSKNENTDLQKQAARALANLAGGDHETKLKITNSFGIVEELLKLLSKHDIPDLQMQGARALANLADGNDDMKFKIVNSRGAIEELVTLLSRDNNPNLQSQAARVLDNLAAGGNDEVKLKIANFLGKSLWKTYERNLQMKAARPWANLISGDDEMKLKVANFVGVAEDPVKLTSLLSYDSLEIQQVVAKLALVSEDNGNEGLL